MKTKYFGAAVASLLLSIPALAQNNIPASGLSAGSLVNMSNFQFVEMLTLSQNNFNMGTARSAAMAGAFTSLGADLSSMSINPAGLGMYRSSDIGFTPTLTFSSMSNSRAAGQGMRTIDGKRTNLGIGNFGVAFNVFEGANSGLTSFTFGVAYNKLADFNYSNVYSLDADQLSIADLFMNQLRGVEVGDIKNGARPEPWYNSGIHPSSWGSVLAFKTGLIDPVNSGNNNALYTINGISPGADIGHYIEDKVTGHIGEYAISGGANFGNILYVGLTLGVQDIFYKQELFYEEYYSNNDVDNDHLKFMQYTPTMAIRGTGYNAKIGAILRPIPELRIGIAFHTPTFYDIERTHSNEMYTEFQDNSYGHVSTSELYFYPKFSSPSRLLTGISYSISDVVLFSVDYDRTWYNGMRLKGDATTADQNQFKSDIKEYLQASNNFRAGMELRPVPEFALRFGYGYYDSGLRTKTNNGESWSPADAVYDRPVIKSSNNYTAGMGYRFNNFYIDAAYSLMQSKYTETDLFYYEGKVPDPNNSGQFIDGKYMLGEVTQKLSKHAVSLTFGYRF